MKPTQNQKREKQTTFKPNKPQPLTPELLRSSSGLYDLTDEQATEAIESLYELARVLLTAALPKKLNLIDNQFVVNCKDIDQKTEKIIPLPEQNDIAA